MFERLLDMLVQLWDLAAPGTVVDVYQNGAVLRFGRFHRTLKPGFHWKWPFVEQVFTENTCETTLRLPPQTLTTRDKQGIVVAAVVKYEVKDMEPYFTLIYDQKDALADVTMGAVRRAIADVSYDELIENPPEDTVLTFVRKEVNRYGFKVHRVTFTDLAKVRSIRLITPHPLDLAN